MDLILNGELRPLDTTDCANLAELIARAEILDQGTESSVVVAVEIDGQALSADELGLLEARGLDNVRRVTVVRRPSREVAWSVLDQAVDYIAQIAPAICEVVSDYRAGRSQRANRVLADILDSMSVLTGITHAIAGVLAEEAKILGALQSEIQPWLEEMLDAQSGEDPIRIADVLEYEIAPRIESWGTAMKALCDGSARPAVDR